MAYAYDRAIALPVHDLYDSLVMAMSINAAKDMYEKGLKLIEDFYNKYGDFISPIQKDMDWYAQNVTGKASDFVNQLYANGIDPLRSAEGRAAVAQLVRSMPIGDIAKVRQSAETAKEYLKSIDDNTNPELEKFLGRDLSTWSTIGGNGVWGASKAAKYQDLNQYTSHIFDNIKDSYIGTDKDHYDWYGVTEDMLAQSLTPDKLGGLLNTDLGRFHYQNAIKDLAAQGITNPTDAQAMAQFRHNVLAANHERVHQDKKLNELWKLQEENRTRLRAASIAHPGSQNSPTNPQYSLAEVIKRRAATSIMGQQIQEYGDNTLSALRDRQINIGKLISNKYLNHSHKKGALDDFEKQYSSTTVAAQDIASYLGYKVVDERSQKMVIPRSEIYRICDRNDVISHTTGFRGRSISTDRRALESADVITGTPTTKVYGAFMKDDRFKNNFGMDIVAYKYVPKKDAEGKDMVDTNGNTVMEAKEVYRRRQYFDSHITSVKNASGSGSLGAYNKKTGKVYDTPGIALTDTQETSFQDAVIGDKRATEKIIKDTVYNPDAILSELPGYGVVNP